MIHHNGRDYTQAEWEEYMSELAKWHGERESRQMMNENRNGCFTWILLAAIGAIIYFIIGANTASAQGIITNLKGRRIYFDSTKCFIPIHDYNPTLTPVDSITPDPGMKYDTNGQPIFPLEKIKTLKISSMHNVPILKILDSGEIIAHAFSADSTYEFTLKIDSSHHVTYFLMEDRKIRQKFRYYPLKFDPIKTKYKKCN